jgi:thiol:disulfide interchange protein DsbA
MKTLLGCLLGLALLATAAGAPAQPLAGREYRVIDPPHAAASGARIEVIEFFSYGCPVCYAAEPHITRWLMKRGTEVEFRRIPSPLPAAWAPFARIYYALEALDLVNRLHWPIFDNHHFDGRRLNNEKNLIDWLSANEVDALLFKQTLDSAEVSAKVAAARGLLDSYGIEAVPTFIVDGRYFTTARMAGGVAEVMEVVEFLIERAREERSKK